MTRKFPSSQLHAPVLAGLRALQRGPCGASCVAGNARRFEAWRVLCVARFVRGEIRAWRGLRRVPVE